MSHSMYICCAHDCARWRSSSEPPSVLAPLAPLPMALPMAGPQGPIDPVGRGPCCVGARAREALGGVARPPQRALRACACAHVCRHVVHAWCAPSSPLTRTRTLLVSNAVCVMPEHAASTPLDALPAFPADCEAAPLPSFGSFAEDDVRLRAACVASWAQCGHAGAQSHARLREGHAGHAPPPLSLSGCTCPVPGPAVGSGAGRCSTASWHWSWRARTQALHGACS